MTKKYWIQVLVCFLVILIGSVLGVYYYQEYISPESFTIGSMSNGTYKELAIKDYLSDDTVLFSQNINDVSFSINDDTATYDYNFDAKEFNGLEKDYLIYVNNYIINDITTNAGTISGAYKINFQDIDNETLCSSNISISFTFRSLSSVLRVSLPASDIGYLLNYFKSDNFIITLAESPFDFGNKEGEVDEKVNQIIELSNEVNSLSNQITVLNSKIAEYIQDIADLTVSDEDKTEQILELQENISSLQTQITTLTTKLTEKSEQLETIQTENADLLEENTSLSALVTNQQQTITSLNQTIIQLQNQVAYYEELLEAYQDSEKLIVTFTVDGSAYEVQLVDENGYATQPETDPTKEGYVFEFWSIDGINEFNFSSTPITSNITIEAVFEKLIKVVFINGNSEILSNYYEKNSEIILPENPSRENYTFLGWTIDETTLVDFEAFNLTENTIFYALFGGYKTYQYNSFDQFEQSASDCLYFGNYTFNISESQSKNLYIFELDLNSIYNYDLLIGKEFTLTIYTTGPDDVIASPTSMAGYYTIEINSFDEEYFQFDDVCSLKLSSDGILTLTSYYSIEAPYRLSCAIGSLSIYEKTL